MCAVLALNNFAKPCTVGDGDGFVKDKASLQDETEEEFAYIPDCMTEENNETNYFQTGPDPLGDICGEKDLDEEPPSKIHRTTKVQSTSSTTKSDPGSVSNVPSFGAAVKMVLSRKSDSERERKLAPAKQKGSYIVIISSIPGQNTAPTTVPVLLLNSTNLEVKCTNPGCEKVFPDHNAMSIHLSLSHSTRDHICEICERTFQKLSAFQTHLRTHRFITKTCDQCGQKFRSFELLRTHMKTHAEKFLHPCEHCTEGFNKKIELWEHMVESHPTLVWSFVCRHVCSSFFQTQEELESHMKQHEHLKCNVCKTYFEGSASLKKHRKHMVESHPTLVWSFVCRDVCWSFFQTQEELESHMKQHEHLKCNVCKTYFERSDALKEHLRFHTSKKDPLQIKYHLCEAVFLYKASLETHTREKHSDGRSRRPRKQNFDSRLKVSGII